MTVDAMKVDAKADSSVLVLKVGTSTIMTSDERGQRVNVANLSRLVEVISDLIHKNYKVVLVSSGQAHLDGMRQMQQVAILLFSSFFNVFPVVCLNHWPAEEGFCIQNHVNTSELPAKTAIGERRSQLPSIFMGIPSKRKAWRAHILM